MKKIIICIGTLIVIISVITGVLLVKQIGFEEKKEQYELVVTMIKNGEIQVQPNGIIVLPNELRKISHSGECVIVEVNDKTAIYFYSFRGILESSRGYLYFTDKISYTDYIDVSKYAASMDFINMVEIELNLYSCSTN